MARPKLKGACHAALALGYIHAFPYLVSLIPSQWMIPTILYLASAIASLTASAALHLSDDPNMRRLDHALIFVYIWACYNITIVTVIPNVSIWVRLALNGGTIVGMIVRLLFTDLPPMVVGMPYVIVGWSILLDPITVYHAFVDMPVAASICLGVGLCYTIGALIYCYQPHVPAPWNEWIGFHEIFHMWSGIGTVGFTYFVFGHCL